MRARGIASRVDDSSVSIGKKYARNDELGTPFGCTVDFASESPPPEKEIRVDKTALQNGTITLR